MSHITRVGSVWNQGNRHTQLVNIWKCKWNEKICYNSLKIRPFHFSQLLGVNIFVYYDLQMKLGCRACSTLWWRICAVNRCFLAFKFCRILSLLLTFFSPEKYIHFMPIILRFYYFFHQFNETIVRFYQPLNVNTYTFNIWS